MIKVGLVGYGFMGHMHAQCHVATGKSQITAVADVEQDKRDEAKAKYGCEVYATVEEMLAQADIDMVDICTPTYLHAEHVIAAARSARHILCEKPMALSVAECDKMIDEANATGVSLMVAHVIRFWPEYQVVKQLVDSMQFGAVLQVSARRLSPPASWCWQNWLNDPAKSGGAVMDLHVHDQDYINYLIGAPTKMQAQGTQGTGGGWDAVMAIGSGYPGGAKSDAEGSLMMSSSFPFGMGLIVACEKASIKLDSGALQTLMVYPNEGVPYAPELPEPQIGASTETSGNLSSLGGYFNEIQYFLSCLASGCKPTVVTPEDAREAVRVCVAVRQSAESGQDVEL